MKFILETVQWCKYRKMVLIFLVLFSTSLDIFKKCQYFFTLLVQFDKISIIYKILIKTLFTS